MTDDENGLEALLAQMQQLQSELAEAEAASAEQSVVGSSGGGAVRIEVSGDFSFDAVKIDPGVVTGNDVALLEDLVLAAIRDGVNQLVQLRNQAMGNAVNNAISGLLGGASLELPAEEPDRPADDER